MPKTIRLVRGTDIFDARTLPGFDDSADTLPDGRQVPKYVFHALEGAPGLDPALRGRAVTLVNALADELLTLPGYTFEEVDPAAAAHDQWRMTLVRDAFGRLLDPATGLVVADPSAPPPVDPARAAAQAPAGEPTPPAQVKAEVQAALAQQPPADQGQAAPDKAQA